MSNEWDVQRDIKSRQRYKFHAPDGATRDRLPIYAAVAVDRRTAYTPGILEFRWLESVID